MSEVLVTGSAGFIGYHVARRLLEQGRAVVGVDNLNDYYDVALKEARLAELARYPGFRFVLADIGDTAALETIFAAARFRQVIHLAAQAGVRYSLINPHIYVSTNLAGTLNVLEDCRRHEIEHLVFASSSSVYGANTVMPFSEHHGVDHPVSLYAATKKSSEMLAHSYAHVFGLPCTGLRFFTVYGPWGRPDMAYFSFTKAIYEGQPIKVFNYGRHKRDFTYVDDIVDGILGVLDHPAAPDPAWSGERPDPATSAAPYRIYNIGNNRPVELMRVIQLLEELTGREAIKEFLPKQPGDVEETYADIADLHAAIGFQPRTSIETGLAAFVDWYRAFYGEASGQRAEQLTVPSPAAD